jgi:cytochrome c-type biogenesis protein CcmH
MSRRPRRLLAMLASLLGASSLLLAPSAPFASGSQSARASLVTVEREVMCVTCKIPLQLAQSPQADRERAFIRSLIARGYTDAAVKSALVAQYGPAVLALPRASGFDLAVYLVPPLALLAMALAVVLLLRRWRRAPAGRAGASGTPAPMSAEDAALLDADLSRFD